ncbi:hypothetical protein Fmac_002430 [Flemingia macrophylla]|uniref:Uncharacterized protein n=1 Tax=Flemingia macrophylla TaxID=520843 RepID=A0ABD1NJX5_9FABA
MDSFFKNRDGCSLYGGSWKTSQFLMIKTLRSQRAKVRCKLHDLVLTHKC